MAEQTRSARAWHRLINDPRRYVDFRGEWQPDEDCELCRALAATQETSPQHVVRSSHGRGHHDG